MVLGEIMWQEMMTAIQAIVITLSAIATLLAATHKLLTLADVSVRDLLGVIRDLNQTKKS